MDCTEPALWCCCCSALPGAGDGNLLFWMVGQGQAVAKVEGAHEGAVLGVAFHPSGHMLASCEWENGRESGAQCGAVCAPNSA